MTCLNAARLSEITRVFYFPFRYVKQTCRICDSFNLLARFSLTHTRLPIPSTCLRSLKEPSKGLCPLSLWRAALYGWWSVLGTAHHKFMAETFQQTTNKRLEFCRKVSTLAKVIFLMDAHCFEPDPKHVYLELSPTEPNKIYLPVKWTQDFSLMGKLVSWQFVNIRAWDIRAILCLCIQTQVLLTSIYVCIGYGSLPS